MRSKNEPRSSGTASQVPAAPREKTSPPQSNSGCFKLLLFSLLILLLLLKISVPIVIISFFQKCFKPVQEEKFTLELTHTMLECKKEIVTMEGKSWSCCPKNWKPFGSSCYFFSSEIRNWTDSKKHCAEMQAHLLVVDSKEEQDFIIKNLDTNEPYYLGLSDLKNGHWEWVNETPYDPSVTYWHQGEPTIGDEHCVTLHFHSQQYHWAWNNIPCFLSQYSICETLKIYL